MNQTSVTFIGHQSWLVEVAGTRILVDPMLTDSFGHSGKLRFEIYPAREVAVQDMPQVDAVAITNEHLDHFHLPSLLQLPVSVKYLMPRMMPRVCVDALISVGREVVFMEFGELLRVSGAELCFLPGGDEAPVWENRVASLIIRSATSHEGGVFIQSDTAAKRPNGILKFHPEVFIATHNGQIPPAGYLGAFDNMLPLRTFEASEVTGLRMLHGILHQAADNFDDVPFVAFSGGGYVQVPAKHGEFLWGDFEQLADIASQLSLTSKVLGLTPGKEAVITGREVEIRDTDWIRARPPSIPVAKSDPNDTTEPDITEVLTPLFDADLTRDDRVLVLHELDAMAPLMMQAKLGRHLISQNMYLDHAVGPHRFVFHFRGFHTVSGDDDGTRVFGLNMNKGSFEELAIGMRESLFTVPAGIDVNAADFLAVIRGQIHIWELAVSRLRQWYLCDRFDSPVGFLYGYFSEQVRPELAARLYEGLIGQGLESF
jgi:hypothetical protein